MWRHYILPSSPRRAIGVLSGLLSVVAVSASAQTPQTTAAVAASRAVMQHPDTAKTQAEWRGAMLRLPKPKTGCYTSAFPVVEWKTVPCGSPPPYPIGSPGKGAQQPEIAKTPIAWRRSLLRLPRPKEGCYTSAFPRVEWKAAVCGPPPPYPILPVRSRSHRFVVGSGSGDYASQVTPTISAVEGSFTSISAGLTESGPIANSGPAITDAYTLQINTNPFTSSACAGSPNPGCQGWEQFVYENNNSAHHVLIQYWLLRYDTTCPSGWNHFSFTGSSTIYCYQSTTTASLPTGVPASSFGTLSLSASVTTTSDQVVVTAGSNAATRVGLNAVAAAAGWTDAEFNVFGDGGNSSGGGQAGFGSNSTITVKQVVHNGTTNAPGCASESFTGETNNLTMVGAPTITTQPSPTLEFTESNVPGTAASCATAAGVGDTHLSTFGGLFYDFQASGDFVLAQTDSGFVVEARQVSGAPTWPDASVNQAVATRMGDTRVAVCTAPTRLAVDGNATNIADGQTLSLPSGIDILHTGNVYLVVDPRGNSMRAELNGSYINVSVGLGQWPARVHGILANVSGHVNQIEARSGTVLTSPFPFDQLYHEYADGWRVPPEQSLLSACGERKAEVGIPTKPLYASNLDPRLARRARAVCTAAGVKVRPLLDACMLDVTVIGSDSAARVFVGPRAPAVVGRVAPRRGREQNQERDKDRQRLKE